MGRSKYIRVARRREIANATVQPMFDLAPATWEFVPDPVHDPGERRQVVRTSLRHLHALGPFRKGDRGMVEILNDIISSRRGKRDANNEHGLWTRRAILVHDLSTESGRKSGKKARLVCREYPEGINVVIRRIVDTMSDDDPLTFIVEVERG